MLPDKVTIIIPSLLFSPFVVWLGLDVVEEVHNYYLTNRLESEVRTFVADIADAQANSVRLGHRLGVETTSHGWNVFIDQGTAWENDPQDVVVSTGIWSAKTKMGSPMRGPFFFSQGQCYINPDTACDESGNHEGKQPSMIFITSDAKRIYTLYLKKVGAADLIFDDY